MEKTFGGLVRAARTRSGLTGQQFAARIGVQQSTLSRYENDQHKEAPPPDVVAAISREFGVSEEDLLRGLGYLSTVPPNAERVPASFPVNSPAAKIVEILRTLPDEQATWVLGTARFAEKQARGEQDEEDLTVHVNTARSRRFGT